MGNKPIKLGITLNKEIYEDGSDLTGIVYLSLSGDNDLQLASTARVYLILKGGEYTRIEGDTKDTIVDCLVNLKVPLKTFPSGRIQPGQYEYPFQWTLPPHLPSTAHFKDVSNQSYCGIQYFITACLKYFKPQSGTLIDCRATQLVSMVGHALSRPCLDYRANVVMEPDFSPFSLAALAKVT